MRAIGSRQAPLSLLQVVDRKGTRLALDDEVGLMTTANGASSFALTEAALALGDRRLVWQDGSYDHAALHTFLGHWIYRDQNLTDLLIPAVWGGVGVCLAGLLLAIPRDLARSRERRHGRRLRGPELVTPRDSPARPRRRHRVPAAAALRLLDTLRAHPAPTESRHFLLMGDTGTGKHPSSPAVATSSGPRRDRHRLRPGREYTPESTRPNGAT